MYLLFCVFTEYFLNIYAYKGIAIFYDKMWVALTTASCCVVAFGGSEKSRLVTASVSARSDVPLL